jgi:hypothetical protein
MMDEQIPCLWINFSFTQKEGKESAYGERTDVDLRFAG